MIARRFLISGMVQGVGYRYFAIRAAQRHDVVGTVRNLPDGRVEVIAEAEPAAMAAFKAELEQGPPHARVRQVEEFELTPTGRFFRFTVDVP
ncbi:MAG: acylphosphatase [Acidobacteriota bacterium]|nr:acylphosphatase [Blastocatellia bacterium]MDW8240550.1 acylphosphatase [Acidobacteriota bacterium]